MEFTKAGVAEQITSVLTESSRRINPSVITQKLKWNKYAITEICTLFKVQKFSEVLKQKKTKTELPMFSFHKQKKSQMPQWRK